MNSISPLSAEQHDDMNLVYSEIAPTAPGWYWVRRKDSESIVQVPFMGAWPTPWREHRDSIIAAADDDPEQRKRIEAIPEAFWRVEWAGPIEAPGPDQQAPCSNTEVSVGVDHHNSSMTTMGIKLYAAGFMFDTRFERVALIRKARPAWQMGKLNGLGGKVEPGETTIETMVREFKEEGGVQTSQDDWGHFLRMSGQSMGGGDYSCDFFATVGDLDKLRLVEAEGVEIVWLHDVNPARTDLVDGIPWIIPMALEFIKSGRPSFVSASS